jgi:hypothetical protein
MTDYQQIENWILFLILQMIKTGFKIDKRWLN